jgi:hypothetical protein
MGSGGPRFGGLRSTRPKAHGKRLAKQRGGSLPSNKGGKTVGIHVRHVKKPKKPTVATAAKGGTTATGTKRKGHPQSAATRAKISASLRARRAKHA